MLFPIWHDEKNSRWIVNASGRKNRKRFICTTREAALAKRAELIEGGKRQMLDGSLEIPTLSATVERYIRVRTATKSTYSQYFEPVVLAQFETYFKAKPFLHQVGLGELEEYQTSLSKNLKPQTINRRFNIIRNLFAHCVRWNLIEKNPTAQLSNLKPIGQKARLILSTEDVSKILGEAKPWVADVLRFLLATGVRRNQAVNLRWSNLSLDDGYVRLDPAERHENKDRRPHVLPLPPDLITFLTRLRNKTKNRSPNGYVFVDDRGRKIRGDRLTKEGRKLLSRVLGLESGSVHLFRHLAITRMLRAGIDLESVRALAQHANIRTTGQYLHSDPHHLKEEIAKINIAPLFL